MRWRVLGVLAAGLLLALPLALLLMARHPAPDVEGWRLLPRLPPEELAALPSFLRKCAKSGDCEPPLACFWDRRYLEQRCTGSDCISDAQCPVGTVCRWIPVEGEAKVAVSHCVPVGTRKEGEPCFRLSSVEEKVGCEPGLLCADWCARPCGSWFSSECPEGFFCATGDVDGPVCLPTCEGRACPDGQRCVHLEGGVSACAVVHGRDCQRESCAQGQRCEVDTRPFRPGEAWMRCVQPCQGQGYRSSGCPSEQSCLDGECRETCDVFTGQGCGSDFTCIPMSSESGVCVLAVEPVDAGTR